MAKGHIRRMAAVNHERTFSAVSCLMYACIYTFIHSHRQAFFRLRQDRPETRLATL
jgi:prephenate dehydrogenase